MTRKYSLDDNSVAVIIGSGAGGGTLANSLAQKGIDVVCLEAGKRLEFKDIVNDEALMFNKFTWLDERIGEGNALPDLPLWTCKTVGGTTMHWTAATPRIQDHEFRARSTYGDIKGTSLVDWPLTLADIEPYYDSAEDRMGVTGTHGIRQLPENNNFKVLKAGARKMGYKDFDTNRMAINPDPRDGRGACLGLGFCTSGCATGAKWCTLYTEITKAEQTDHFELRTECMAVKLETDASNRVTSVHYLDKEGKLHKQRARFVSVAGNAVETTRLLLNSRNEQFPGGLANSSDQVGRNYLRHLLLGMVAVMPGEVDVYKGAQAAGVIRDETRHDPARGFSGGFQLHVVPLTPRTLGTMMMPEKWGRELTAALEQYRNFAMLLVVGEDMPVPDNRISLHPTRKDHNGLPVPIVRYLHHANNRAMQKYSLDAARRLYQSLGAKQVYELVDVFPSTHNLGVARMGIDPKTSVCDKWGRTHDIENLFISDGSLFPTASCENPTITIVALVLRQADRIAELIKQGAV
jgi:choline dehydrogenase-like flavoprotein